MPRERIVAIGLLTDADLHRLGPEFEHAYPLDNSPCFQELLRAIDETERQRRGAAAGGGEDRQNIEPPLRLVPNPLGSATPAGLPGRAPAG